MIDINKQLKLQSMFEPMCQIFIKVSDK